MSFVYVLRVGRPSELLNDLITWFIGVVEKCYEDI